MQFRSRAQLSNLPMKMRVRPSSTSPLRAVQRITVRRLASGLREGERL